MKNSLIWLIVVFFLFSCSQGLKEDHHDNNATRNEIKESLIRTNKHMVGVEEEDIENYVKRYGWKMKQTNTGLWYMIYEQHGRRKPHTGDELLVTYRIELLNGDFCYGTSENNPDILRIGMGDAVSGLEEGLLLMGEGDRAKLIIPSHLAFGLTGDQDKIPLKAALVYDIKLLKIR